MMFDFDAGKLLIIGVVALVVIGPKDLPRVLRQVGQAVGKLRRMAADFQGQFMEAMKEADLQDLKSEVAKIKETATLDLNFDPVRDVRAEMTKAVEDTPPSAVIAASVGAESSAAAAANEVLPAAVPPPEHGPVLEHRPASEHGTSSEPGPTLAAAGIAPVAPEDPGTAPEIGARAPAVAPQLDPEPRERRRVVVPKRRVPPSDKGGPGARGPASPRARYLPPVRRETVDR